MPIYYLGCLVASQERQAGLWRLVRRDCYRVLLVPCSFVLEAGVPELEGEKRMKEPQITSQEDLNPRSEPVGAGVIEKAGVDSSLGRVLCVCWMVAVLLGFLVIRVIGSESFQSLHLFGKAR
jgi:hypothetical protein